MRATENYNQKFGDKVENFDLISAKSNYLNLSDFVSSYYFMGLFLVSRISWSILYSAYQYAVSFLA